MGAHFHEPRYHNFSNFFKISMAKVEAAKAVSKTWERTLAAYKNDLPPKDIALVQQTTSASDIARHIEHLENNRHAGKSGAFADKIHAITSHLTQFGNVIDVITSSNPEASLIWGTLKLLLTIVHRSAEEYGKICRSILAVSESFPTVELLATTFDHSDLVCNHVSAFYNSVLQFWSKALRFYRRRRIFNLVRAWHDFESEFGDLDSDMKRYGRNIQDGAAAVHMDEARLARLEQKAVNRELMKATRSSANPHHHRDIAQWLAPSNHEATYFMDDLYSARSARHPGTCTWILERPTFKGWMNSDVKNSKSRLLWVSGIPGSGKTVLSSYVIDNCLKASNHGPLPRILYFFFKQTDSDKNSTLSVARSLIYQLYTFLPSVLTDDIIASKDASGKDRCLNHERLWEMLERHVKYIPNLSIVLDALDECDDIDILLARLLPLLQCSQIRLLFFSRREKNISLTLGSYPTLTVTQEDVEADILAYINAEVQNISRFRGKPVQERIITALSLGHGGMFLWAYLMVNELKEIVTVKQMDETLSRLPQGLEEMHHIIITRLNSTLHRAHRQIAIRILTWIVCAIRPLRLDELQDILRVETQADMPSDDSWTEPDEFLYSANDIELACGALVTHRNGTLQLIHLSTKEILLTTPPQILANDSRLAFYVNEQTEGPRLARVCVQYFSECLANAKSLARPDLEAMPRLQIIEERPDPTNLLAQHPFVDYACTSWQPHLINGRTGPDLVDTLTRLQKLLSYEFTLLWIEAFTVLRPSGVLMLKRHCNEMMLWADEKFVPKESSCYEGIGFLWAWSHAMVAILDDYSIAIQAYPYEIHYLDFSGYFVRSDARPSFALPPSYVTNERCNVRENIVKINTADGVRPKVEIDPSRMLQYDIFQSDLNRWRVPVRLLLYDDRRDVYYTTNFERRGGNETIWAQQKTTG